MKNNNKDIDHNNPDHWVWGVFYFNRNDKRIFPPKRNPYMGFTINFANPLSIGIFMLIIVLCFLVAYLKNGTL